MNARSPNGDLLPLLRPSLFVVVAAAHVVAFGYGSWSARPPAVAPRLSIEVTLASPPPAVEAAPAEEALLQDAPIETPAETPPEPAPVEPPIPAETPPEPVREPLPEPLTETPPEPVEEPAPEPPPEAVAPEPEPPKIVTATPPPRPDDAAPFVAPPAKPVVRKPAVRKPEVRKPEVRKPTAKPKPRVATPAPPRVRAAPQTAGSESRAQASVASTTQYGAVISAAIRARTVFPQSARASGGGVVVVAFVIGPSGRAQSASVVRSSGESALDRAALAAVRGVSAPPPPGGRYAATAPIRFSLQ